MLSALGIRSREPGGNGAELAGEPVQLRGQLGLGAEPEDTPEEGLAAGRAEEVAGFPGGDEGAPCPGYRFGEL